MKSWMIGLCCLFAQAVAADTDVEVITLKHRLANDMLPHVEAILPENATARAYGDKLIIKADRATIANIELLLEKLDLPQQSVTITVLKTDHRVGSTRAAQDNIQLQAGDDISGSVSINRWSSKDSRQRDQQYRSRGIAGQPVSISMGQDIPQQEHLVFVNPYGGVGVQSSTYYVATDNGFQAVPFLLPDNRVKVEIHPFFSQMSRRNGSIDSSDVITTVIGEVGQWLEIGYISENADQHTDGTTRYRSDSSTQQYIYLKVEKSSN